MITGLRVVAAAFLLIAALSGALFIQASVNYMNVTKTAALMEEGVEIVSVNLTWNGSPNSDAQITTQFRFTNPGTIAVVIITVEFDIFMDDTRDLPGRGRASPGEYVATGAISHGKIGAPRVVPGGEAFETIVVRVRPGTSAFDAFNTSEDGLYFPIMRMRQVVISFTEFDVDRQFFPSAGYNNPEEGIRLG